MAVLKLDLLHPLPRPHGLGWLLLLAGIGATLGVGWQSWRLDAALAEESARAAKLKPPAAQRAVSRAPAPTPSEVLAAREALALPWSRLLSGLETVQSPRIALLALDADGRKPEATVTAEARSLRDVLAYVERLKREAGFRRVVLTSHQVQEDDPQRPVRFVVRLGWRQ